MSEILRYHCKNCDFITQSRKNIRRHQKEIHKLKGQHAPAGVDREPISAYYERR